jgi:hypothetical protein
MAYLLPTTHALAVALLSLIAGSAVIGCCNTGDLGGGLVVTLHA